MSFMIDERLFSLSLEERAKLYICCF